MKLLLPLGLIALIGIPILILIYIIKPRYQEKNISSTYIWKLSLKYRKKKIPFQWLQKSLLFIIQLCVIALIAFSLAEPNMLIASKNSEKIIILDASASMNAISSTNQTRFDKAKKEIMKLVKNVNEENPMSVILDDGVPHFVLRRETSNKYIEYVISNLEATFNHENVEDSILLANEILDENLNAQVLLYTDYSYESSGYVHVNDMSNHEYNAAILDFKSTLVDGYYHFNATLASYNKDSNLTVQILVDGKDEYTFPVSLKKNVEQEFKIDNLSITSYKSVSLSLLNTKDTFSYDDQYSLFDGEKSKFKVELIGENTTFLNAAIQAVGGCDVYLANETEKIKYEGYDLYVFDNVAIEQLPVDGEVWILNCNNIPEILEYKVDGEIQGDFYLEATHSDSPIYQKIMPNLTIETVGITKYQKVTLLGNYDVCMTCNGDPILFSKTINKTKVSVFAMDLHYSELPLSINMAILIHNLINYTLLPTNKQHLYQVGDEILLHAKVNANTMYVNDEEVYNVYDLTNDFNYVLIAPGVYTIVQTLSNEKTITNHFYAILERNESNFSYKGDVLTMNEYQSSTGNKNVSTDGHDIIIYLAAILLFLLVLEWGLSYHEQY